MKNILNWFSRHWWVVSVLAGVVVFVIALVLAQGVSVWYDEGYSIFIAKQTTAELLAHTAVDAHPPLYYLLLKWWGGLFEFNETAMRAMSAVFAGATVGLGLSLTKRLFGVRAALMVLPAVVLAPFLLRYSYEVRMYSLVSLLGVGATYALVLARDTQKRAWWAVYAVLVALGMYALYASAVIWLAHVVWLTWDSVKAKRALKKWRWPLVYVGAAALFIPYMSTFFGHLATSVLSKVGTEVSLTQLVNVFTVFTTYTTEWATGGWVSIALLVLLIGLIGFTVAAFRRARGDVRKYLVLYACLSGVPLLFFALMSLPPREPIFLPRYMAHVALWVYALPVVGLALSTGFVKKKWRVYVTYGLLLVILTYGTINLAIKGNVTLERAQTPMAKQLRAEFDGAGMTCDDATVVADGPYVYLETIYYYPDCDMKFHYPEDFAYRGGYAPLSGSELRIEHTRDIRSEYLVHLRESSPALDIDGRYELVKSTEMDKQFLDIYRLQAN